MRVSIQGMMSDGSPAPADLLAKATWTVEDPSVAKIESGQIVPVSNGTTKATVNVQGVKSNVIIIVNTPELDRIVVDKTVLGTVVGQLIIINIG